MNDFLWIWLEEVYKRVLGGDTLYGYEEMPKTGLILEFQRRFGQTKDVLWLDRSCSYTMIN